MFLKYLFCLILLICFPSFIGQVTWPYLCVWVLCVHHILCLAFERALSVVCLSIWTTHVSFNVNDLAILFYLSSSVSVSTLTYTFIVIVVDVVIVSYKFYVCPTLFIIIIIITTVIWCFSFFCCFFVQFFL